MKKSSIWLAALLLLYGVQALADNRPINIIDDRNVIAGEEEATRASRAQADASRWRFAFGAGGLSAPVYPGADSNFGSAVPIVHARRGAFFAGIGGVGYDLLRREDWLATVSLSPSRGRKQSDDPRLQGMGRIDSTVRANAQLEWNRGILQVRAGASSDIAGNEQGTLLRFDALVRLPLSASTVLIAGPGLTWADARHADSYFSIGQPQSTRSGLPAYDAGAGLNSARFTFTVLQRFAGRWLGVASLSAAKLTGDAADSPVTLEKKQLQFFAGAVYIL